MPFPYQRPREQASQIGHLIEALNGRKDELNGPLGSESLRFQRVGNAHTADGQVRAMMSHPRQRGIKVGALYQRYAASQPPQFVGHQGLIQIRRRYLGERHTALIAQETCERDLQLGVWQEMDALRSALAIAQVLGRSLILPEMICGGEPEANIPQVLDAVRCTADSFLDVQALLAAFPDLRESSFIENDRVPLERVRPSSRLLIISGERFHGQYSRKDGGREEEDERTENLFTSFVSARPTDR